MVSDIDDITTRAPSTFRPAASRARAWSAEKSPLNDLAEGPCLDSLYDQHPIRLSDIHAERRWPRFVARATELGVGSMLAVQLFVDGEGLGALNLLSREVNAFDDDSEHVALLFASHAAVAMSGERVRGRLQAAVSTREVIGQAHGILMERFKITGEMAFHMLMLTSQDSNRKLRDIADELVSTGVLPGPEASPGVRPRPAAQPGAACPGRGRTPTSWAFGPATEAVGRVGPDVSGGRRRGGCQ